MWIEIHKVRSASGFTAKSWFLDALHRAVDKAHLTLDAVLTKARFWRHWATTPMNERQVKLLNQLLDGFEGKLTSSK